MSADVFDANVRLAEAFGLSLDRLASFTVHVRPGELPIVEARYYADDATVRTACTRLSLPLATTARVAFEAGYVACERGQSLQQALSGFREATPSP